MNDKKKISVVVDNRLRIKTSDLSKDAIDRLSNLFIHSNPQHYKLKKMGFKAWKEPKIIKTHEFEVDSNGVEWLTLPRGGTDRLREVVTSCGFSLEFVDRRTEGDWSLVCRYGQHGLSSFDGALRFPPHQVALWEHQTRIVDAVIKRENCVVRSATGSGKTSATLASITKINLPAIVVVWEKGLLKQWLERAAIELGLYDDDVGIIGQGEYRLRPLTVAMQQSLNKFSDEKWVEIKAAFGVVVGEELSRFAAATFQKTIDRFPARYRIGISAEEKRKDGKEFLIYDLFGKIGVDVDAPEMVAAGIVLDVEVRVVPTAFRADWYVEQRADEGRVPDFNRLLEEMTADEARNNLVMSTVAKATEGDRQALVFSHRVEHCRSLDSLFASYGIRSGVMVGEDPERYEQTVMGLRSGDRQVGIGTFGKIGLGLDLPAVAAGVIATPCHSNRPMYMQVTGRLSRTAKGKTDAVLWYLWDQHVHGLYPLYNLRRWSASVKIELEMGSVGIDDYLEGKKTRRKQWQNTK